MSKWFGIALVLIIIGVIGLALFNKPTVRKETGKMENTTSQATTKLQVTPITHATMVLKLGGQVIYTDPVGGMDAFKGQPEPTIILVTDIHGDHMSAETLQAVATDGTITVVPQAVKDQLPDSIPGTIVVMKNGEKATQKGIEIEAIPMYNIPESETAFHTKGRGNGYVVSADGERIYIAGDTSVTPEMKALQNIDVAFIPMNLPYTMGVDEAAEGVVAFKPKVVHPYHYQGQDGFADVNKFKELVEASDPNIKVQLLNFYP